jgi:hypothetical protein
VAGRRVDKWSADARYFGFNSTADTFSLGSFAGNASGDQSNDRASRAEDKGCGHAGFDVPPKWLFENAPMRK